MKTYEVFILLINHLETKDPDNYLGRAPAFVLSKQCSKPPEKCSLRAKIPLSLF